MAVVADASTLALDSLIDAAFAGRTAELEIQFGKARTAGTAPGTISRRRCARSRNCTRRGSRSRTALRSTRRARNPPFVHFSRKTAVEAALRTWTSPRLERAMAQLAEATLEARRQSQLAD